MSAPLFEIVMLADGEVVLQRSDELSEPLVRIIFSDEAKSFLQDASLQVAQAMIDAGIHHVEQLETESSELSEIRFDTDTLTRTLH